MLIKLNGIKSAEEVMELSALAWAVDQALLITGNGISVDTRQGSVSQ